MRTDMKRCPSCIAVIPARSTCCEECVVKRRERVVAEALAPEMGLGDDELGVALAKRDSLSPTPNNQYSLSRMEAASGRGHAPRRCGHCDACTGGLGMRVGRMTVRSDCAMPWNGFLSVSR